MNIFTIGFARHSAQEFFSNLQHARVSGLLDVRLRNTSQLAGFTKRGDLEYFLKEICGIPYSHDANLAPTGEMLDRYKKHGGNWKDFESAFTRILEQRNAHRDWPKESLDGKVLLCSEQTAKHCHRRLVAEYFQSRYGGTIHHL